MKSKKQYSHDSHERLWQCHKAMFNLKIKNDDEKYIYGYYLQTHEFIMEHNENEAKYKVGHNHLSHWCHDDYKTWLTLKTKEINDDSMCITYTPENIKLPRHFDLRTIHCVSRVKDQGQCGSCWAFSTVGCIESVRSVGTGKSEEYSEQQLVDCCSDNYGCNGGFMDVAMKYVITCGGLKSEKDYPYCGKQGSCKKGSGDGKISRIRYLKGGDEVGMAEMIYKYGAVSVAINASARGFMMYQNGIFHDPLADKNQLNHAVLLVGFGTENGQDYWIVKNSWSDKWGENGYFRLVRGQNEIGIANMAVQRFSYRIGCYPVSCIYYRPLTSLNPEPLPKIPDSCINNSNIISDDIKQWKPRKFYWHTLPFYYASASKLRLTCTLLVFFLFVLALVVLTTLGGCVLAPTSFQLVPVVATCLGSFLCSCSANTLNQIFEYPHDSQSTRTQKRLLPLGLTSVPHLSFFAAITAISGLACIYYLANPLTFGLAISNLILYSFIYTPMKQISIYNTWVGSIVGAIPPLAGWACLMNSVDYRAFLLPLILYSWQFPHFNSLSWMIRDDYAKSGYQMMVNIDWDLTKRVTLRHALSVCAVCYLIPILNLTSPLFAVLISIPNGLLVYHTVKFNRKPCKSSSLKLFKTSLAYMTLVLLLLYLFKLYPVKMDNLTLKTPSPVCLADQ